MFRIGLICLLLSPGSLFCFYNAHFLALAFVLFLIIYVLIYLCVYSFVYGGDYYCGYVNVEIRYQYLLSIFLACCVLYSLGQGMSLNMKLLICLDWLTIEFWDSPVSALSPNIWTCQAYRRPKYRSSIDATVLLPMESSLQTHMQTHTHANTHTHTT